MSELKIIFAAGAALAIVVLGAMLHVERAQNETLRSAIVERDGVIERQNRQAQQLSAAHKIEQIRGDSARRQVATGDAATKAATTRADKLNASLIEARKEIANARSSDAPAGPILVRSYERMLEFAASYRALRSGDGLLPGDGGGAHPAAAAGSAGPGLVPALTEGQFADACVGTAAALGEIASNVVALRDDFLPAYNANVRDFNARAVPLALQGVMPK